MPENEHRIDEISKFENKEKNKIGSFVKTLAYFSNLPSKEIFALYALRCSLVHDYFLLNNSGQKYLNHHFSVNQGAGGKIVSLPNKQWNGELRNRNENNKTLINLELLGDLVEKIHGLLIIKASKGSLGIKSKTRLEYITYNKQKIKE